MKPVTKSISLIVTQSCNLNCTYCYEQSKSKKEMSFDMAFSILERYLASNGTEYDDCSIELFGGEPFLNFPLIKELCEAIWERDWKKNYTFRTTTNGTLIHGEIQDWIRANQHRLFIGLSLDGTPEMHNMNRSNSFSKIDLNFFQNLDPKPSIKMTLSNETLLSLAEGTIFLHSLGFPIITNNLAYSIDWTNSSNVDLLVKELNHLEEYYLAHPEITPSSILDMKIEYQGHNEKKWCGTGTDMVAYDVDGKDYACQMFIPLSIGQAEAESSRKIDFFIKDNFFDPKCKSCIINAICPTCYGSNYHEHDNVATRSNQLCQLNKVTALANAHFQAKKILMDKNLKELDQEKYLVAKAALKIQQEIVVDPGFFL